MSRLTIVRTCCFDDTYETNSHALCMQGAEHDLLRSNHAVIQSERRINSDGMQMNIFFEVRELICCCVVSHIRSGDEGVALIYAQQ